MPRIIKGAQKKLMEKSLTYPDMHGNGRGRDIRLRSK